MAQKYHRVESIMEKAGEVNVQNIRPLNEERAVQLGCEMVWIYTVQCVRKGE